VAETGQLTFQYQDVDDNGMEQGDSATVGIENATGDDALQYSFDQPQTGNRTAIQFTLPPSAFVQGTVTDGNDGEPVSGARVRALQDGAVVRQTSTDATGHYRTQLPLGRYTIEASATHYRTGTADVVLDREDEFVSRDFGLPAARAQVSPTALELTIPPGQTRPATITLSNTGTLDLGWQAGERAVAAGTSAGKVEAVGRGVDSRTPEKGYAPKSVARVLTGGPVLVFMDVLPWGSDALTQVLNANGIRYDVANSGQMGSLDLAGYEAVFISSDQPQSFYARYAANRARFADYVVGGGFLWFGAAAWGWNDGDLSGAELPGGMTVRQTLEDRNDVLDNAHPTMQGVPDPFSGSFASHASFQNVPDGAKVIAVGESSRQPTLVEYELGAGLVLALGQTLEFGWQYGADSGRILENGVPYAYAFEPALDVPWLSVTPGSGTLAPGASQAVTVTVDTTGLQPGVYRARVVILSNDPRNPLLQVPVTLAVPAYYRAVEAGGGDYTDRAGDLWSADRQYAPGGFGYTNRSAREARTTRPISGTEDDRLYQTQRVNPTEYRFDGLPTGVYEVDLGFAEVSVRQPGTRLFDVIAENTVLLPAHDAAGEVGSFAADRHRARIAVTDGQLNIRFVERRGYAPPIVNAIRVVDQPLG
ncbi:MAG TPA: malectin domain-containing carbohydrate-binding protein, partial [Actinoplanes sp.]|nr:malectin domain-containing carbohydrate-binding protein [Actinoplanes sp.]